MARGVYKCAADRNDARERGDRAGARVKNSPLCTAIFLLPFRAHMYTIYASTCDCCRACGSRAVSKRCGDDELFREN